MASSRAIDQQRLREAERVDQVYQYVLAQIGAATIEEALLIWQDVPTDQTAATVAQWLDRATKVIKQQRGRARELGVAYFRLARALRTGRTIPNPLLDEAEPNQISLEGLRQQFDAVVDSRSTPLPKGAEIDAQRVSDLSKAVEDQLAEPATKHIDPIDDSDAITVEEIRGIREELAVEAESEDAYIRTVLNDMGTDLLKKKVGKIDGKLPKNKADATARQEHLAVGAQVASSGARVAMNGGKGFVEKATRNDPRAIGWVRQSTTGHPCYFCAMLISRGILYKSKAMAERVGGVYDPVDGNANKYHDNCYCIAVAVYSMEDFKSSPAYAENRKYADLWSNNINGKYGGKEAMRQWRYLLRSTGTKAALAAA